MGRGIAAFARAGFPTAIVDLDESALKAGDPGHNEYRPRSGGRECKRLIEAVPELLDLKQDIFHRLASAAPKGALLGGKESVVVQDAPGLATSRAQVSTDNESGV
jgi:3-hydroxyacyl-CoA dehydrogenase